MTIPLDRSVDRDDELEDLRERREELARQAQILHTKCRTADASWEACLEEYQMLHYHVEQLTTECARAVLGQCMHNDQLDAGLIERNPDWLWEHDPERYGALMECARWINAVRLDVVSGIADIKGWIDQRGYKLRMHAKSMTLAELFDEKNADMLAAIPDEEMSQIQRDAAERWQAEQDAKKVKP